MNSEKAKYFLSISDNMIREFMVLFYVFSSRKKRMSSEFSPFERSLSIQGLNNLGSCPVKDCYLPGFCPSEG